MGYTLYVPHYTVHNIMCHPVAYSSLNNNMLPYPINLLDGINLDFVCFSGTKQVSHRFWTSKTWSSCGNPTGSACSRMCRRSTGGSTTTLDPSNLRTSNDDNASCLIMQLRFWMQFAKNYYYFIVFTWILLKKIYHKSSRTPLYSVNSSNRLTNKV